MLRNGSSGEAETGGGSSENDVISAGPSLVGEPVQKELSLVAVLIVAGGLVAGLVALGKFLPPPRHPPSWDVDPEVHFRCLTCGHEFVIDRDDLTKEQMFMEGESSGIITDCPKCGVAQATIQLSKCPKCEKYYLPKWRHPGGCFQPDSNVCEHCNLDVNRWYIDEAKKRMKTTTKTAPKTETPDSP